MTLKIITLIISQTIIIALIALYIGIVIGIALVVNENKTPDNPMTKMYNNFLSKDLQEKNMKI